MISVLDEDLPVLMLDSAEKLSDAITVLDKPFSSIHRNASNTAINSVVYTDKWSDNLFFIDVSLTGIHTAAPTHPLSGSLEPIVKMKTKSKKFFLT